jgi:hypothetical protein
MRMGISATVGLLAFIGCGKNVVVVPDPGLREALIELEQVVAEAKGAVGTAAGILATPKPSSSEEGSGDDEIPPQQLILSAVQMVSGPAEDVVRLATGTPHEADAQAIRTEANALVEKSRTQPSATEASQVLDQLRSKAEAIKAKL